MSDTPQIEMRLSESSDLWWLDPFHPRHSYGRSGKKRKNKDVVLALSPALYEKYRAIGGAAAVKRLIEAAAIPEHVRAAAEMGRAK